MIKDKKRSVTNSASIKVENHIFVIWLAILEIFFLNDRFCCLVELKFKMKKTKRFAPSLTS